MTDTESELLINTTAAHLGIKHLIDDEYVSELITQAEGHPYVIKILLGEVAKEKRAGKIARLVASRDEILTALFERTYASLTPCAQRAFMTLAAWNSAVPRVALEAVLHQSIGERTEVEEAIDVLLQYSLAEEQKSTEGLNFIALPLVATIFGQRKVNVSPLKAAIKADVDILQMLGPVTKGEVYFSLAKQIEHFLGGIARRMDKGDSFDKYAPIVEMISRHFPPAWLSLARMHMEELSKSGYEKAIIYIERYLEYDSNSPTAATAWNDLAHCYFKTDNLLGDVHAFVQRSKIDTVPFVDLANTARLLNDLIRKQKLAAGTDETRALGRDLLVILKRRQDEAKADDFAQMAWLALRLGDHPGAREFVRRGLALEPENYYLLKLAEEPNITMRNRH